MPSERDLAKQFGVSRTVIREAVRALDAKGLLDVRTGTRIRIGAVDAKTVRECLRHFVCSSALDYAGVAEAGVAVDVAAAGLAALRAGAADLDRLSAALDRMTDAGDDLRAAARADLAFRRAITTASHNELLLLLHDSVDDALADMRAEPPVDARGECLLVLRAHRSVVDAIARRDPEAAQRAMLELLDHAGVPATANG